jgi:hypothetical protein
LQAVAKDVQGWSRMATIDFVGKKWWKEELTPSLLVMFASKSQQRTFHILSGS